MIDEKAIEQLAASADMIVCGYAFTQKEGGNISVINVYPPYHAAIITTDGEMIESDMDDIELSIVLDYWKRNKKYMEEYKYA